MGGGSHLTAVQIEREGMTVDQAVFIRRVVVAAEHQVPQGIGDLLAFIGFHLLHDVRMVADDQIRALIDAVVPDRLLGGITVVGARRSPNGS